MAFGAVLAEELLAGAYGVRPVFVRIPGHTSFLWGQRESAKLGVAFASRVICTVCADERAEQKGQDGKNDKQGTAHWNKLLIRHPKPPISYEIPQRKVKRWLSPFNPKPGEMRKVAPLGSCQPRMGAA